MAIGQQPPGTPPGLDSHSYSTIHRAGPASRPKNRGADLIEAYLVIRHRLRGGFFEPNGVFGGFLGGGGLVRWISELEKRWESLLPGLVSSA